MEEKQCFNIEVLNKYLKENNLTVKDFCKKCNITLKEYEKFLKSDGTLKAHVLYNVSKTTKIKCDILINIKNKFP